MEFSTKLVDRFSHRQLKRPLRSLNSIAVSLFLLTGWSCLHTVAAHSELPSSSLKIPPMVKEQSVSTYIPSSAAPGQGLAVNVIYPKKTRYTEGAPVVVVVPSGNSASGLDFSMHSAQQGFIEVRFAFQGGGKEGFHSSGIYDFRGGQSREALRDVLRFAAGKVADHQGKTIQQLVPVTAYNAAVGAVGWSNGGNILLNTMAAFHSDLQFISWVAFYESPIGAIFFPPALGGAQDLFANRHYRQGTAATGKPIIDFRKLMYQEEHTKHPGSHKKAGELEIPGVLFFDENGNRIWEEATEFAFTYSTDLGFDKQIYAPAVTKGLIHNANLPSWPYQVATVSEAQAYFDERDASLRIKDVAKNFPNLLVTIFASRLDHLQRQQDHPHIALQYNAWLGQKIKFLRLNPDPFYVAAAADMHSGSFVNNHPNASIDSETIDQHLESEGLVPDYIFMEAAVAELSDRVYKGRTAGSLKATLVKYTNGLTPPPVPAGSKPSFP
jgi:hypothetical protein